MSTIILEKTIKVIISLWYIFTCVFIYSLFSLPFPKCLLRIICHVQNSSEYLAAVVSVTLPYAYIVLTTLFRRAVEKFKTKEQLKIETRG